MRVGVPRMPILADHVGEWRGRYVHIDPDGRVLDEHASHLACWVPEDGSHDVVQVNTYTWDDGREEQFRFGGTVDDGVCYFRTERIVGEMSQVDDHVIVLTWHYTHDPENYLYELIQLSRDGQHKCRTWHWMENDRLVRRTIISEERVSDQVSADQREP